MYFLNQSSVVVGRMEDLYSLVEADVPGASLSGRKPRDLHVPELKRWLACRGASRRGEHAELVKRRVSDTCADIS